MSNNVQIFRASDECIDYLADNSDAVWPFQQGSKKPNSDLDFDGKVPASWPTEELETVGLDELNHNNTTLYHWILNGTIDDVEGSGTIFQTWASSDHDAVEVGEESFAFKSHQLPALLALVEKVDVTSAQAHYTAWLGYMDNEYVPTTDDEAKAFVKELMDFGKGLKQAIAAKEGLLWTA